MDNRRQLKIASVIQEAFTDILLRQGKSIYGKAFVTVTKVKVTSDLTLVRFYLSIYNAPEPDAVLQSFNEHKVEIKRELGIKLRHDLRRIPEIEFFRDDTLDYVDRIEHVFQKIKEEEKALADDIVAAEKKPRKAPAKKKAAAPKKKSAK
ncbi:MAG: 30S ribosome-binding factor RbfA [Chitinophagales bacterium]